MELRHDRRELQKEIKKPPQAVIADRSSPTLAMDATTNAASDAKYRTPSPPRPENSGPTPPLRLPAATHIYQSMVKALDPTDYSVVVKYRAPPPKSWKWEIYRAGRASPIEQSSVYFQTMTMASRAGSEALKQLLEKLRSEYLPLPLA